MIIHSGVLALGNQSRMRRDSRSTSRVQGVPHKAVLADKGRTMRLRKLAHTLKCHSRANALITDLQKTDTFNPFSKESKKTIPTWVMSSSENYVKSLQKRNVCLGLDIGLREPCIATADNACCCQRSKNG